MAGTPTSPALAFPRSNLAALTVTPYDIAEDGTWFTSYAGPTSLLGYFEEVNLTLMQELSNERSADSPFDNNVALYTGFDLVMIEKLRIVGEQGGPVIPNILASYSNVKVVIQGGSTAGHIGTWTCYGVWDGAPFTIPGSRNELIGIRCKQADVSYASSGILPVSYVES